MFVSLIDGEREGEEEREGDATNCLFDEDHAVAVHTESDKGLIIIIDKLKKRSFDLKV